MDCNTRKYIGYMRFIINALIIVMILVASPVSMAANNKDVTIFGTQRWPGVTVKTKVATLILEAIGYPTETKAFSSSIIYLSIANDDVDISMGAWMPTHKTMLQPLLNKGRATELTKNLGGAVQGLAVPDYTWKSGIHSVKDLVAHGKRFHRKIYAIGAGAGLTQAFQKAVKENYEGLGDWTVAPSSVAGMMAQVERATSHHNPIVFHGWKPHWMNVKYDIRFLKDTSDSKIADIKVNVFTIARSGWTAEHPQVANFLRQFHVSTKTQSQWIYGYSYKKKSADEVARQWIAQNMEEVTGWLKGVHTAKGGAASDAVRAAFEDNSER